jgi:CheY-like chemotaxis protein
MAGEKRIKRELEVARDAADAASRAKSQFLANMSHEVRTPINGIMGMNSLLFETPLSAQQHEYASTLRQCSHALLDLVNDVLDFSQLDTGRAGLCEHPLVLEPWLTETIELYRGEAEAKGLHFEWKCAGSVPTRIVADGGRLCQILLSLVSNAVKFTDRGEVFVSVSSRPIEPPAGAVVSVPWHELKFSVRDTGIGIPPDRVSVMFQEFSQVDTSMARRHGGMGLGLVVTERLAALMGGGIGVESQPGKGSTFTVTVRVREKVAAAAADPASVLLEPSGTSTPAAVTPPRILAAQWPLRILLAEDNVVNQRVASRLLKRFGYECDVAGNGFEVLEALERRGFDVVLMDVHMPEMDGLEATREILRRHPAGTRPQIIAITAHASTQDRDSCLAAGMDDFLTKPVVPGVLEARLRDAAGRLAQRSAVAPVV